MQVGTREMLLDDTLLFMKKAKEKGTKVHLEISQGQFHVQPILFPKSQNSRKLIEKVACFIREVTNIENK